MTENLSSTPIIDLSEYRGAKAYVSAALLKEGQNITLTEEQKRLVGYTALYMLMWRMPTMDHLRNLEAIEKKLTIELGYNEERLELNRINAHNFLRGWEATQKTVQRTRTTSQEQVLIR